MAHHGRGSPDSLDVRLENRSSDDSLILDETNTRGESLWADSEAEPPTFQIRSNGRPGGYASGRPSSVVGFSSDWKEPWNSLSTKAQAPSDGLHGVYSASMQTRLSLSGEESEVPLLSTGSWLPGGFVEDIRHCHSQALIPVNNSAWRRLMSASLLCLFFMIAEIVGGYFVGSVAVMTDAAHLLSDLVGLLVSLLAVWLGQRPPTKTLSFGFHRAEVLGALFSIFVIWVLTGIFVYVAGNRLVDGSIDIKADGMMAVAAGGIVINIVMGLILHGGCPQIPHSHGFGHHGHSHGFSEDSDNQLGPIAHNSTSTHGHEHSPKSTNINVRAATIHVLGDLIQSVGVFIAAVVIKFNPEAKAADPICTFIFAIVVLATTVPLFRDTCLILLEGFPPTLNYNQVSAVLNDIPGVKHVHSLHVWSLTAGKPALSVHLAVEGAVDRDAVTCRAQQILQTKFGIQFCTIQTESFDLMMINSCFECKPPS